HICHFLTSYLWIRLLHKPGKLMGMDYERTAKRSRSLSHVASHFLGRYEIVVADTAGCCQKTVSNIIARVVDALAHPDIVQQFIKFKPEDEQWCRANFCMEMLETGTTFSTWVFTDECTVQIDCSTRFCFVKSGDQISRMRHRAKHPAKGPYLGWDFYAGATKLAILPGDRKIDSELYCRILEKCYLPFKEQVYNGFCELVQDNTPPHKSRYTTDKISEWGIETVSWPAESPDLNPIELVWGNMKSYIRKQGVRKLDDLKAAILRYWKTLTPEVCAKNNTLVVQGVK
ncbi:hypothetical protein OSTOST_25989, partial [Ostertagia ostertagi]